MKDEIFQLKVTIEGSEPPIWRQFQVHNGLNFLGLHYVIQAVMNWDSCHAYEFVIKERRLLMPEMLDSPFNMEREPEYMDQVELHEVLKRVGQKFLYIYDFGDNWKHEIVFEKRLPLDEDVTYPVCIDGALATPPEDCGGIWGYYQKLDIINDKAEYADEESTEEVKDWMGDFNPDYFNIDEINQRLEAQFEGNINVDEVVVNFFYEIEGHFTISDFFRETGLEDTEEMTRRVHDFIYEGGFVEDEGRFHPQISFLKDMAFRIVPTEFELDNGVLIPGHSILPFLPFDTGMSDVEFSHKYIPFDEKIVTISDRQVGDYFGLLDPKAFYFIDSEPLGDGTNMRQILALDFGSFYKKYHFKLGDTLIVKPVNFLEPSFDIRYSPTKNLKKHEHEIAEWDRLFLENFKKVLAMDIPKPDAAKQLMYAFYYMSRSMSPKLKKIPGSNEVLTLLAESKEVVLSETEDSGKIFRLRD